MQNCLSKKTPTLRVLQAAVLTTVIALTIYANVLEAPFVFDDLPNITENPHIRMTRFVPEDLAQVLKSRSPHRPLANFSFAVNYFLHGYDVRGYHMVNLAIHITTALLVLLLTRQTMNLCGTKPGLIPFAAATLWLVNPVHTQSVTYIIQRMNSLSAMLVILALVSYIQARSLLLQKTGRAKSIFYFAVCVLSGMLGLVSKETAAALPIIIFLYEWYFFQNFNGAWLKKQFPWVIASIALLVIISLVYMGGTPLDKLAAMYQKRGFTPAQRLLTEPGVVIYYICLLIFPHPARLILDYDFPLSANLTGPPIPLLAIIALLGLSVTAIYSARKTRLLSFTLTWFLVTLIIESSIIGLDLIYEHRTYLPSIFPTIGLTVLICRHVRPKVMIIGILCVAVSMFAIWTYQRNKTWQNGLVLWQDNAAKTPRNASTYVNMGIVYKNMGEIDRAMGFYKMACEKSIGKEEIYYIALSNMGELFLMQDRPQEAAACLENVISGSPEFENAHINLGVALMRMGRTDDAIRSYNNALAVNPYLEKAYNNLGNAWFRKGEMEQAINAFKRALKIRPLYPEARDNLATVKKSIDKYGDIIHQAETTVKQQPDDPQSAYLAGQINQAAGMIDRSIVWYEQALALDPGRVLYLNALGNSYAATGMIEAAVGVFEQMARQIPDNPTVFYNLACLYARWNNEGKAITNLKEAVKKGYNRWDYMENDQNLKNLHKTDFFKQFVRHGKIRQP